MNHYFVKHSELKSYDGISSHNKAQILQPQQNQGHYSSSLRYETGIFLIDSSLNKMLRLLIIKSKKWVKIEFLTLHMKETPNLHDSHRKAQICP